jgi:hypothetical protein
MVAMGFVLVVVPTPHLSFTPVAAATTVELPGPAPVTPAQLAEVQAAADEPLDGERVQAGDADVEGFSVMGVTFDGPPEEPVMVRTRGADGSWGEWNELSADPSEGPDPGSPEAAAAHAWGTAPIYVGEGRGYEVNLGAADAADASVVLVREETRRAVTTAEPLAGASVPAPFGIGSRASWGARAAGPYSYGSTIKKAVVHHTVSSNSYAAAEVPGILRGIQAYHIDGRGWTDIGYNFLVDRFGGIWEGRGGGVDRPVVGAHASGFNTDTVGISVIGDYTAASPSAAVLESVSRVAGWKLFLGNRNPSATEAFTSAGGPRYAAGTVVNLPNVIGHTDVGLTECPGSIWSSLGQIRNRAQEWTNWIKVTASPIGNLESIGAGAGTVTATGWAGDRSSGLPPTVSLVVGGVSVSAPTSIARPDVVANNPDLPLASGFVLTATGVRPGLQDACVSVADTDGGVPLAFPCARLRVGDPTGTSPDGRITQLGGFTGGFRVGGWTADVDGPGSRRVTVTVDGRSMGTYWTAPTGLFELTFRGLIAGRRDVCVVVSNSGAGSDVRADCRPVDIAGSSPFGNFEGFELRGRDAYLSGWALDPESPGIPVHIYLDGSRSWAANGGGYRPDVQANHGMGANSGWSFGIAALPDGQHTVCAIALNVGAGSNTTLGCRTFVVK